jgi:ribonucleotide reductase beta subunit family protein with ferritin-like domain
MNKDAPFGERLVAFACIEGISFTSSFCAIFYLKKQGLMCQGLGKSNELISRDEGMHRDFACAIYKLLLPEEQISAEKVHEIIRGCVEVEHDFVCEALPVSLIGMNSDQMQKYVEFVADSLCVALGYGKVYGSTNPFEWMEQISLTGKTNFFEGRVAEYAKAGFNKQKDAELQVFTADADF